MAFMPAQHSPQYAIAASGQRILHFSLLPLRRQVVDGEHLDFRIGLQAVEAKNLGKEVELAVQRIFDILGLAEAVLLALVDLEGRGHLLLEERLVLRGSDASRR